MSRQYFAIQLEFTHGFYGYINIVSVDKKYWEKELIFIWILGQMGEWQGERAYINNRPICKDCEYLAYRTLQVNLFT